MTTLSIKKPINYLNNRDMLAEIHASKNSFCSFSDPSYNVYDYIIDLPDCKLEQSLEKMLDEEILLAARETRAARLSTETNTRINEGDIQNKDLVFRVMTWDHIPLAPKVSRKAPIKRTARDIIDLDDSTVDAIFEDIEDETSIKEIDDMIHSKVNFPPFQHFMLNNNLPVCVGKSHWKGDITNGYFSKDHGNITKKLAKMYILMCEKYSTKWNWRGYSYVDEFRQSAILQLTYVGLRFNEAKSNNPFAYFTATITNSFCRVLNTEKKNQNIRDDLLEIAGLNPSYTRAMNANPNFE